MANILSILHITANSIVTLNKTLQTLSFGKYHRKSIKPLGHLIGELIFQDAVEDAGVVVLDGVDGVVLLDEVDGVVVLDEVDGVVLLDEVVVLDEVDGVLVVDDVDGVPGLDDVDGVVVLDEVDGVGAT